MITLAAMVAGALTSAAWIAPRPLCYICLLASSLLVLWIRSSV